jgi:hypothetical protein
LDRAKYSEFTSASGALTVIGTAANVSDVPKAHELLGHFLKSC